MQRERIGEKKKKKQKKLYKKKKKERKGLKRDDPMKFYDLFDDDVCFY